MTAPEPLAGGRPRAAAMNRACQCFPVSRDKLVAALHDSPLKEEHSGLVAGSAVFVGGGDAAAIADFARDLLATVALPGFRDAALRQAGAAAQRDPGIAGGLLGLDFHLTADGPKLIEVNTNPGGVLINVEIQDALQACCAEAARWLPALPGAGAVRDRVFAVFEREWRQAGGRGSPTLAIVDDHPETQYLYPEFRLFQALFESRGWRSLIADPRTLHDRDGRLWSDQVALDLVYNRLTDFALEHASSAALRAAYLAGGVVLTPHPRAHALHADKRLLAWLSDESRLLELGAPRAVAQRVSARVPPTFEVRAEDADRWWRDRDDYYFKPAAGYGGKAAYAGAKLTRKAFEQVLAGHYLAQQAVDPPRRERGAAESLKYDLRAYVDPVGGDVLLMAARLYRGQTTNFRTAGGGFAPVVVVTAEEDPVPDPCPAPPRMPA